MAVTKSFLEAVANRRTIYAISSENAPVDTSRVHEIITDIVKHTPSPYNAQTARAVIVSGEQHIKYWNHVYEAMPNVLPAEVWPMMEPRVKAFRDGGAGTVLWFEDQDSVQELIKSHPMITPFAESWSDQSSGMHQINSWTALEAEGFGASLQHFHFAPAVVGYMNDTLKVPISWTPKAQLVYGTPLAPAGEKTFKPIDERLKVYA